MFFWGEKSNGYVANNCGNQEFPEIPGHFQKCLSNQGISGIA